MTPDSTLLLNDGHVMPRLGMGVWRVSNAEAAQVVSAGIEAGYRLVDTASMYGNEAGVGEAVRAAPGGRGSVFLTTKLWNDRHGYDGAFRSLDESLGRLGLDTVDLFLIHWPQPSSDLYVDTWRALIRMKQDGRVGSIGVSNFAPEHLQRLIDETGVAPSVNQVELHPAFQQTALRDVHARHGIVTQAWRPLGKGALLDRPEIGAIAAKHTRTAAQVIIRWHLQSGLATIPKSATPSRLRENLDVFGFALDAADMAAIAALDQDGGRMGADPTFTGQ